VCGKEGGTNPGRDREGRKYTKERKSSRLYYQIFCLLDQVLNHEESQEVGGDENCPWTLAGQGKAKNCGRSEVTLRQRYGGEQQSPSTDPDRGDVRDGPSIYRYWIDGSQSSEGERTSLARTLRRAKTK